MRKLSSCNYLGAIFLGGNCTGGGGGVNFMGAVALGRNCPGGNCPVPL